MEITVTKMESFFAVDIDGVEVKNVVDYKITNSAHGGTELELKIADASTVMEFVSTAS